MIDLSWKLSPKEIDCNRYFIYAASLFLSIFSTSTLPNDIPIHQDKPQYQALLIDAKATQAKTSSELECLTVRDDVLAKKRDTDQLSLIHI